MADVLKRLYGPAALASGSTTLFTVPAGHTYSVRSIVVINNEAVTIKVRLGINGTANANLITPPLSMGPSGKLTVLTYLIVLNAGDTLQANADVANATVSVMGMDSG